MGKEYKIARPGSLYYRSRVVDRLEYEATERLFSITRDNEVLTRKKSADLINDLRKSTQDEELADEIESVILADQLLRTVQGLSLSNHWENVIVILADIMKIPAEEIKVIRSAGELRIY